MTRFLVYTEGETEVVYVRELLKLFRCSQFATVQKAPRPQPFMMAEDAAKHVWWSQLTEEEPYDCAWLIFDQDSHNCYDAAIAIAKRIPFLRVVWSNPCIEAWFLMHFIDIEKILTFQQRHTFEVRSLKTRGKPALKESHKRKVARPKTAYSLLKRIWRDYKKNAPGGYLPKLLPRIATALNPVHNSKNPAKFGSAFGEFIGFLMVVGRVMPAEINRYFYPNPPAESLETLTLSDASDGRRSATKKLQEKLLRLVGAGDLTPYSDVKSQTDELLPFLMQFPFKSSEDAGRALAAAVTASAADQLEHTPVIILNCEGTGRAKDIFEDILLQMAEPKNVLKTNFPTKESGRKRIDKKAPDCLVLHARGKVPHAGLLESLCQKERMPLTVIIGNKLDISEFADTALEIRFKSSRTVPDVPDAELLTRYRNALRGLTYYLNGHTRIEAREESRKLIFWRRMCLPVVKSTGGGSVTVHIRDDI